MTINLTAEFFRNNKLVRKNDIAELKGTRLAIDGHFWIRNLQFNEPYQMAMGGVPLGLQTGIDAAIEKLTKYDIKPLFIFNGIKLPPAPPMNRLLPKGLQPPPPPGARLQLPPRPLYLPPHLAFWPPGANF